MLPSRPFYFISLSITIVTRTAFVIHMLSVGDFDFLKWKNGHAYIEAQRNRVFKQLTLAIITFRVSKHMLKRSVIAFLIFTVVVIKLLTIQVKLVKLVRALKPFNGPLRLAACIMLSGAFFYFKLFIEVSWAVYYLVMLCRNPPVKDSYVLLAGLLRLLEWK
ncbi:hypothetical protein JVU11DRAFT_6945 [Chiua virens]|nr:hypothetical protein JVU11DRAFT_6945 [Chiua virens]